MDSIEPWLLSLLACPRCHGELQLGPDKADLNCSHCAVTYPIEEGIPQLLIEAARPDKNARTSAGNDR